MEELDSEQTYQLHKMIKRSKAYDTMTPQLGDIYIFSSLDGKKRAVYCDSKTFSVFRSKVEEEEYIDDGCYRKRRFRK